LLSNNKRAIFARNFWDMKRFTTALLSGLVLLYACKGKSGHGPSGQDSSLHFSVDTAQIRQVDSAAARQRRSDSELLSKADSAPGINAGIGNFNISTPAGWRRTDTVLGKIRALLLTTASPNARFRTNISVVSDSMRGLSADNYIQGTVASLATYVQQFSLIGKGERTIGDRPARWLHYAQSPGGIGLEDICYIVPDKGIAYIITCSALKGQLLQNRRAFEQAIMSFKLH
jgi:hypothetical protein